MVEVIVEPGTTVEVDGPGFDVSVATPAWDFEAATPAWTFEIVPPDRVAETTPLATDLEVLLLPGPQGPTGPPGPPGSSYHFAQVTPAASWFIQHNLQRYPAVVVRVDGEHIYTDITYHDENALTLDFPQPVAGFVDM